MAENGLGRGKPEQVPRARMLANVGRKACKGSRQKHTPCGPVSRSPQAFVHPTWSRQTQWRQLWPLDSTGAPGSRTALAPLCPCGQASAKARLARCQSSNAGHPSVAWLI